MATHCYENTPQSVAERGDERARKQLPAAFLAVPAQFGLHRASDQRPDTCTMKHSSRGASLEHDRGRNAVSQGEAPGACTMLSEQNLNLKRIIAPAISPSRASRPKRGVGGSQCHAGSTHGPLHGPNPAIYCSIQALGRCSRARAWLDPKSDTLLLLLLLLWQVARRARPASCSWGQAAGAGQAEGVQQGP